jgi:hypothetical protein
MTADEVGKLIGTSRTTVLRSAHALGIPVRTGGAAIPLSGPEEIELIKALYEDDLIASVLDAHDIPRIAPGGPIWERSPEPVPLSAPLVKDLYWYCGAGLSHIELLTGQPADTVPGFMRREAIPTRHPGGADPVPAALAHEAGTGPRYVPPPQRRPRTATNNLPRKPRGRRGMTRQRRTHPDSMVMPAAFFFGGLVQIPSWRS